MNPTDEMIDLTDQQRQQAKGLTIARWEENKDAEKSEKPPETAAGTDIRKVRRKTNGLLLIYPLDSRHARINNASKPVIGIAISFPKSETALEITYTVNNVFTRRGGDDDSL